MTLSVQVCINAAKVIGQLEAAQRQLRQRRLDNDSSVTWSQDSSLCYVDGQRQLAGRPRCRRTSGLRGLCPVYRRRRRLAYLRRRLSSPPRRRGFRDVTGPRLPTSGFRWCRRVPEVRVNDEGSGDGDRGAVQSQTELAGVARDSNESPVFEVQRRQRREAKCIVGVWGCTAWLWHLQQTTQWRRGISNTFIIYALHNPSSPQFYVGNSSVMLILVLKDQI